MRFDFKPLKEGLNILRTAKLASVESAKFGTARGKSHQGIDIRTDGTRYRCYAVGDATVADVRYQRDANGKVIGFGLQVWLKLDKPDAKGRPVFVQYAHLSEAFVKTNDRVKAGEVVGLTGSSGNAAGMVTLETGAHLHFGVSNVLWPGTGLSKWRNPLEFFDLDPTP